MIKEYEKLLLDDVGTVKAFKGLHDAKFISIEDCIEDKIVNLSLISEDGMYKYNVKLRGVVKSRCDDWLFGNIIFDISILSNATLEKYYSEKEALDIICYADGMCNSEKPAKRIFDIWDKIQNNALILFQISPSYGANYLAIVKDVEISSTAIK